MTIEQQRAVAMANARLRMTQAEPEAPPPDKYQQAALDDRAKTEAAGLSQDAGLARLGIQGATGNTADEILAGLMTPLEMIRRKTFDPREGYSYAKAAEDLALTKGREKAGWAGTAADIAGGVLSGSSLARGGLTAARALAPNAGLGARSAASAADAAIMGGVAGAGEGNTVSERLGNAGTGAAIGGGLGGATPGALRVAGALLSPITSNIRARVNPTGYAQSQVARAMMESSQTPQQIAKQVTDASAAGQGVFTVADAMGNSGQRMLSAVTRAPGEGRTAVTDFLNARQAGQGERMSQIVDEALGSSGTARATADDLTKIARTESSPYYEKALTQKPVWNERIQQFFDDPITKRGLKEGIDVQRLEALAEGKKFDPKDYAITGFNDAGDPIMSGVPNMRTINLIKKGWDNVLEGYRDSTTGKLMLDEKGRAIDAVRRSFLKEIDSVNPDYAKARELYAGPAQARDAVALGGKAATRGRAADNVRQFDALNTTNQQGYRIGYADKLNEGIERGAEGVNKARPFTSEKRQGEMGALSLHQGPVQPGSSDPLTQRLARENTMFETRAQALGGSKTADNLADQGAMGVDPTLVGNVLTGNWGGAARGLLSAGQNALTGNTPAVRQEVARILTMRGGNVSQAQMHDILNQAINRVRAIQNITALLGRGAAGGLAVAPATQR